MKSSIYIASQLFKVIKVPTITNIINGKVYVNGVPDGDQLENIDINTLANLRNYLQTGFINVNIYVRETKSGRPNTKKFKEIVDTLIPLIEDVQSDDVYFQIDDDKGIFKDQDRDSMYFYNLRLTFQTL